MRFVVDVNVPVVSNGNSPQASKQCELNCLRFITRLIKNSKIVLDSKDKILAEYTKHLASKNLPSVSAEFYKWIVSNYANSNKCEKVVIHYNSQRGFVEFPNDRRLIRFDHKDRKYIAVAIAHPNHPIIAQAVDRKWKASENDLRRHKVRILFL